jgi:hypothetical protein
MLFLVRLERLSPNRTMDGSFSRKMSVEQESIVHRDAVEKSVTCFEMYVGLAQYVVTQGQK